MKTEPSLQQALACFSGIWTRHNHDEKQMQQLRSLGLIEQRPSRSHLPNSRLFRLTAKGMAAKAAMAPFVEKLNVERSMSETRRRSDR